MQFWYQIGFGKKPNYGARRQLQLLMVRWNAASVGPTVRKIVLRKHAETLSFTSAGCCHDACLGPELECENGLAGHR